MHTTSSSTNLQNSKNDHRIQNDNLCEDPGTANTQCTGTDGKPPLARSVR